MRTRADIITTLEIDGHKYRVDEAGYLIDPDQWDVNFAKYVSDEQQLILQEIHWDLLRFMRSYLEKHSIAADTRFTVGELARLKNIDKKTARIEMFKLFPYGYVRQACKISGMRQPRAWSTG